MLLLIPVTRAVVQKARKLYKKTVAVKDLFTEMSVHRQARPQGCWTRQLQPQAMQPAAAVVEEYVIARVYSFAASGHAAVMRGAHLAAALDALIDPNGAVVAGAHFCDARDDVARRLAQCEVADGGAGFNACGSRKARQAILAHALPC